MALLSAGSHPGAPWFGAHRSRAVVVAVVLFAGIFGLRLAVGDAEDVVSLFYALPIALVAMSCGLRCGAAAAAAGVALTVAWTVIDGIDLSALGWATRVLPLLLLGVLVGRAADDLEAARVTEQELLATQLREREAAEINDSIVQSLVAAKWLIESGEPDRGATHLGEAIERTQALVSELLRERPVTPGTFRRRTEVQTFEPGRR
jgi:hypothetical protein